MAGITLTNAETQLALWLGALTAVASGQEYQIADRKLKKANLADIQDQVTFWDNKVKNLSRGGIKIIGGTPV